MKGHEFVKKYEYRSLGDENCFNCKYSMYKYNINYGYEHYLLCKKRENDDVLEFCVCDLFERG